jgi:hypothetical protein
LQALLPAVIYALLSCDVLDLNPDAPVESPSAGPSKSRAQSSTWGFKSSLIVLTISALATTLTLDRAETTTALGLSYAALQAVGFLLVEKARIAAHSNRQYGESVIYSTSGLLNQQTRAPENGHDTELSILQSVSLAATIGCTVVSLVLENLSLGDLDYRTPYERVKDTPWRPGQAMQSTGHLLIIVLAHIAMYLSLLFMVSSCFVLSAIQQHTIPGQAHQKPQKSSRRL